uniref:Xylanolytic transcriptional activator regulatory domain-containing protein n=1 Tax=Kwoniella dejecticola CBS 10117 TaxID=1296121 RepID=A0A1A5ZY97_9TREE|nr:uncharacterized protein I303_06347 [Kwoniella dejecticola CBS 10117]OBR82790.1 hypothetical protein I303_06347 [Kwoniella dejecticola CBS 10117]
MVDEANREADKSKDFAARRDGPACDGQKMPLRCPSTDITIAVDSSTSLYSMQKSEDTMYVLSNGVGLKYLRSRRAQQAAKTSIDGGSPVTASVYAHVPSTPSYSTYPSHPQPRSSTSVSTLSSYHDHVPPPPPVHSSNPTSNPSSSLYSLLSVDPASTVNPLDAVLPRPLLLEIISLFYRCVYPLMPVPHKTTFMTDIHSRREELGGQQEWIAMVLSILAFTLVQMPHHLVSITKNEIRELVEKLSQKVKSCLMEDHQTISLERLITVYCIGTVHNNLGRHMQSRALHGSNVVHCLQLGLNEESTYASMDPINAESHRRLFWAVYCSDRSAACSENGNLLFNEDEINVAIPKDLDDQFITRSGFLEPPLGHASVMRGFTESCRLFSMGGNMLSKRMHDRSRPPSGYALRGRINELDDILQGIERLLDDCQPEMRLGWTDMGLLPTQLEGGFVDAVPDMLRDLISTSHADSTPFLVHSGHVRVTQQLFRFLTLQYREDLSQILYHEQIRQTTIRPVLLPSQPRSEEHNKRKVLEDLLQILHGIPLEIHAINSFPGISKIRSVSASLLTSLSAPAGSESNGASAQDERSMELLCDFLRLMATIERMYSLIAEPSTASTDGH